jgi:hypothetical protein
MEDDISWVSPVNGVSSLARGRAADEIRDLRRHLGLVDTASRGIGNPMGVPLTRVLLVPIAGAIDKNALDVLVDRAKYCLATRPRDRKVEIYAPDNKGVRIVQTGKEIRTIERGEF